MTWLVILVVVVTLCLWVPSTRKSAEFLRNINVGKLICALEIFSRAFYFLHFSVDFNEKIF